MCAGRPRRTFRGDLSRRMIFCRDVTQQGSCRCDGGRAGAWRERVLECGQERWRRLVARAPILPCSLGSRVMAAVK
jgi:hypothetical protein